MTKFESILAATDFSNGGRFAAERAAVLAAATGVRSGGLLHVLESSWLDLLKEFASLSPALEQQLAEEAMHALETMAGEIRERRGFALAPLLRVGKALDAIIQVGADFDVLVLGAHGAHPIRELALGTTATRILRKCHQSVVVVKQEPRGPYERVLVATDFSPYSARALDLARAVAPRAALHLAHVFDVPFEGKLHYARVSEEMIHEYRVKARIEADAEMRRFVEASGLASHPPVAVIEHGYAPAALRERARSMNADLVVVGRHGKSVTEELLLGSVTVHLLAEVHCDVLVVQ